MKKFNYILGVFAACSMFMASCSNELPEFDDADAFVAFTSKTLSVDETGSSIDVPVLLTSLAGLQGTATIEVVDSLSTAVAGENYVIEGSMSLNFTKEEPTQNLTIKVIDNGEFTGDLTLTLNIVSMDGANLGANTTCTVTIVDDEHPLGFLFGSYSAVAESNFGGVTVDGTVYMVKDNSDVNVVWIGNMVPGATTEYVYGIVNDDKTEIKIPVGQTINTQSNYPTVTLEGYAYPDMDRMSAGASITAYIQEDGSIVINDAYGACVYDASGSQLGWFELLVGSVWTKQ